MRAPSAFAALHFIQSTFLCTGFLHGYHVDLFSPLGMCCWFGVNVFMLGFFPSSNRCLSVLLAFDFNAFFQLCPVFFSKYFYLYAFMAASAITYDKKLGLKKVCNFCPQPQSTLVNLLGVCISFYQFKATYWVWVGKRGTWAFNALQSCGIAAFYKCSSGRHLITVCNGHFLQWV